MTVDNVKVYGLEESIKASKYPMSVDINKCNNEITNTTKKLGSSNKGEGHDQFLTGITVQFDLTCSNKMWVEAERYRFLYFVSSQSTMHRITKFDLDKSYNEYVDPRIIEIIKEKVKKYNDMCNPTNLIPQSIEEQKSIEESKKRQYLEILYSNPAGFELTARMATNYRQLKTIYSQRKNHRLPEWCEFCAWIETLPMFKELCLGGDKNE